MNTTTTKKMLEKLLYDYKYITKTTGDNKDRFERTDEPAS